MPLKGWLLAAGILLATVSWVVLRYAGMRIGIAVTLVNSLVMVVAILIERYHYKPMLDQVPEIGDWTETDERFVDPKTGRLIRVMFSPSTGERLYVKVNPSRR